MKYAVLDRGDELSKQLTEKLHYLAGERHLQRDEKSPDVVVSIGGDGTMLHAFHMYQYRLESVCFVGIHTGHLGFYADWKASEIETLLDAMASPDTALHQRIVKYPLVETELVSVDGTETHLALNELTIKGLNATLVARLTINDEPFEMFRGDGICISSPSGSTAYNKSLGGAMVHPSLETIQIAEIASINNRVYRTLGSSLVLPKHHHCDIEPRKNQVLLVAKDHIPLQRNDLLSIRCRVSTRKVAFARYRPFPFWNRVRDAFIGSQID
ncbi:NAD kinase [Paenibacillus turpanensis]|uniref:NAD kinase n=1 Tax=Paenibacillus turpanensis TaxID=2689078 RepID=UPI001407F063|nr:NAD kinase [Paenibacillus turpanensis]